MAIKVRFVNLNNPDRAHKSNFHLALSHWRQVILFGLLWGGILALHTIGKLFWLGWQTPSSILMLSLLMFIGASTGGALGWFISIWFSARRVSPKRFATSLVFILLFTISTAALLFALHYRMYYSQWHMSIFSIGWFIQALFTGLSALYLFAVQGSRLLLPFAPIGLIIAAITFARIAPQNSKKR